MWKRVNINNDATTTTKCKMEDEDRNHGNVFSIPDLWAPSRFLSDAPEKSSFLFSQLKLYGLYSIHIHHLPTNSVLDIDQVLPDVVETPEPNDVFFQIPDLLSISAEDGLPTNFATDHPLEAPEALNVEGEPIDDIWLLADEIPLKAANYQSWDSFENPKFTEIHTPYITEAGPAIFDAALAAKEDYLPVRKTDDIIVDPKIYISSLLALGLGRNSLLWTWDSEKQSFRSELENVKISGYTLESLNSFLGTFMDCGNITRALQKFVDHSYAKLSSPGRIALADAVSSLLATIQSRLSASAVTSNSILQLEALFQPAHSILICFRRIVTNIGTTRSDESMLSTIFEETQLLEHRTDSLREIILEVLARVSRPWLEFTGEWLGLQREAGLLMTKEGRGKSFVKVENKEWIDEQGLEMQEPDYVLDYDRVPAFIAPEDARALFEVGRSLRFLKAHHRDHPLAKSDVVASANPPTLEWKFSWEDVVQVETKALQYEKDLTAAIQQYSQVAEEPEKPEVASDSFEYKLELFGKPEEDMQAHVLASIGTLGLPLDGNVALDHLTLGLSRYLTSKDGAIDEESIFAPPISLAPVLSFNPIIAAQARIVNGTCMRMFFKSHRLREHLSVQRSFHLLGNGVFSSRLSHALFDPGLESAERHRGVARSGGIMGLRLGGRDTWPPASSELRLALMGVLTESYISTNSTKTSHTGTYLDQTSLPGDLSFAVRDMSPVEIEACMNADSLSALDFLRLSYKPPNPLEAVITPMILYKYDQLFKLLLRCLRMLYTVSALFRDATDRTSYWRGVDNVAQRFRIECHHFVASVCSYFFDTGIDSTWRIFDRKLDELEQRLNSTETIALGLNEGVDKLRDYHEQVLDRIMFSLFLRKRQKPVLNLLEEIFTLILQFSKHSRERALGLKRRIGQDEDVRELYLRFRKKVGVFISVLRGMSEKKGFGENRRLEIKRDGGGGMFDGAELVEENTVMQLLVKLEMSGYYGRKVDL